MTTAQMLPVAALLDRAGFAGPETWGGATIESCLRFLGENPFDRLRALKKAVPHTPQLMLLRGQNIVQYTAFPDDVVEAFINCTSDAGCDIFHYCWGIAFPVKAVERAHERTRGEMGGKTRSGLASSGAVAKAISSNLAAVAGNLYRRRTNGPGPEKSRFVIVMKRLLYRKIKHI
jgi:hypothetical protein